MLQVQTSSGRSTNALQDSPQDSARHQGRQKETPQEAERPGCSGRRPCPNRPQYPRRPTRFQRNSHRSMRARDGFSVLLPSSSSCFGPGLVISLYYLPTPLSSNIPCHLSNRAAISHVVLCRQALWCISLYCLIVLCSIASLATAFSPPFAFLSPPLLPHLPSPPRYLNTPSNLFFLCSHLGSENLVLRSRRSTRRPPSSFTFHLVPVIPVSLPLTCMHALSPIVSRIEVKPAGPSTNERCSIPSSLLSYTTWHRPVLDTYRPESRGDQIIHILDD